MEPLNVPTRGPAGDRRSRAAGGAHTRTWVVVSATEALAACVVVLRDVAIPSLVLLAMAFVSLLARRRGLVTLGLTRSVGWTLVAQTLGFAAVWSVFQLSVTMPLATHLSGKRQDLSAFEDLQGNLGMLAALLVVGWLLGAFAEELAYRGYLFTRLREAAGNGRAALLVAVLASSTLFGFAHSEQGVVGILVVSIDGIYFTLLRLRYKTLWASVLAHGFNNTMGFIAFYLVGPIYGFW